MEASPAPDPRRRSTARAASTARSARAVSAIGIARTRRCSRTGCTDPATATLVFSYHEQVARVVELLEEREPQTYDLCGSHADRTTPPRGWELSDTRPPRGDRPRRLEDEDTVAVIAAALRGEDPPRRVDVIEGGTGPSTPRRVTRARVPSRVDPGTPAGVNRTGPTGVTVGDAAGDEDEDPLRAALEELQRVVVPEEDASPRATPPAADDGGAEDRPTLW